MKKKKVSASHMLSSFFSSNLLVEKLLQALAGSYSGHPPAKVAAAPPGMWPVRVDGPKRLNQRSRLFFMAKRFTVQESACQNCVGGGLGFRVWGVGCRV